MWLYKATSIIRGKSHKGQENSDKESKNTRGGCVSFARYKYRRSSILNEISMNMDTYVRIHVHVFLSIHTVVFTCMTICKSSTVHARNFVHLVGLPCWTNAHKHRLLKINVQMFFCFVNFYQSKHCCDVNLMLMFIAVCWWKN